MAEQLLNTVEDMEWLLDVHVPNDLAISWKPRAAVIHGNEDCPDQIDLYPRQEPLYTDTPLTGKYDAHNDTYTFCGPLDAQTALEIDKQERQQGR